MERDATLAAIRDSGGEETLDNWLRWNLLDPGDSDSYDAELLEIIPDEFQDEYEERLRLHSYYEAKFAEQQEKKEKK